MKEGYLKEHYGQWWSLYSQTSLEMLPDICTESWLRSVVGEQQYDWDISSVQAFLNDKVSCILNSGQHLDGCIAAAILFESQGINVKKYTEIITALRFLSLAESLLLEAFSESEEVDEEHRVSDLMEIGKKFAVSFFSRYFVGFLAFYRNHVGDDKRRLALHKLLISSRLDSGISVATRIYSRDKGVIGERTYFCAMTRSYLPVPWVNAAKLANVFSTTGSVNKDLVKMARCLQELALLDQEIRDLRSYNVTPVSANKLKRDSYSVSAYIARRYCSERIKNIPGHFANKRGALLHDEKVRHGVEGILMRHREDSKRNALLACVDSCSYEPIRSYINSFSEFNEEIEITKKNV